VEHEPSQKSWKLKFGTLLGPEKTPGGVFSAGLLLTWTSNVPCVGVVGSVMVGVWLCVECCIVDASILLWLKCVRAHGGCLGIRSR
jgi:hypothetical protein